MLSDADRKKAADILMDAEKERKQAVQLSTTWPGITIEDAYAISSEVTQRKIAAGAKLIGHKIGLTSKAMQQSSQIDEPDYGHLLDYMMIADGAKVPHADYCRAARRDRARLRARQAAEGPGRRPRRRAARDRIRRAGDRDHRRARAEPAQDLRHRRRQRRRRRHRARRPAGAGRWTSTCAGSAASSTAIPRSRRPGVAAGVLGHPALGVAWLANKVGAFGAVLEPGHLMLSGSFTRAGLGAEGRHAARRLRPARQHRRAVRVTAPMELPRNAFKHAIAAGELQIGLWCSLCEPHRRRDRLATAASTGSCSTPSIRRTRCRTSCAQLQAVQARHGVADRARRLERCRADQARTRRRRADASSCPMCRTRRRRSAPSRRRAIRRPASAASPAAGAPAATAASRTTSRKPMARSACWCRSRPAKALDRLEAIAAVDGVDGVFIGPSDLSASFGQIGNPRHRRCRRRSRTPVRRLQAIGKPAGILTPNEEEARRYIDGATPSSRSAPTSGCWRANADALAKRFKG